MTETPRSFATTREGILRLFLSDPGVSSASHALLFDRDGVINERIFGAYVTKWSEFKFINGIAEVLASLSALGLPMIIVSNQAGVGKGLVSENSLKEITHHFVADLAARGARIDAVYYCPHRPDDRCVCRKPAPGLLTRAAADWSLDLRSSVLIGDSESDLAAAKAVQCPSILFSSLASAAAPSRAASGQLPRSADTLVSAVRLLLRDAPAPPR